MLLRNVEGLLLCDDEGLADLPLAEGAPVPHLVVTAAVGLPATPTCWQRKGGRTTWIAVTMPAMLLMLMRSTFGLSRTQPAT